MGIKVETKKMEVGQRVVGDNAVVAIKEVEETRVKLLMKNDQDEYVECEYQEWQYFDDNSDLNSNCYVSTGKLVAVENLEEIKTEYFRDNVEEGRRFHLHIRKLIDEAPPEADYLWYLGASKLFELKGWRAVVARLFNKPECTYLHYFAFAKFF